MTQQTTTTAGIPAGPNDADNLYLKQFPGEVQKVFLTKTVMKGRFMERTISAGRSAQFPAIGKAAAEYHTPGNLLLGQDVNHGEIVVNVDDLLVSTAFVSNFEEAMIHYEVRGEYARQMGDSLAQAYDQQLFAVATKACVDGASGAVAEMGSATRDAIGATPTTTNIVDAIYAAAQHFDETDIPQNDRIAFVTPSTYWNLIKDGSMLDRDFGNVNGSQSGGNIYRVAGVEIVPTNNLAKNFGTDTLSGTRAGSAHTEYDVDGSSTVALVAQRQALGTVHLMGMATEKDYQVERQGTLMVARYACGHKALRPECLRLIDAAAS